KRGRRSIESQGGTAVDRRRTQNRVAQRAYRQRKELATDALKQRIVQLEKLNEDIGREFVRFTDLILRQQFIEYFPEIAKHLQQTTLSLLRITRDKDFSTSKPLASSNSRPSPLPSSSTSATSGLERLQAHDLPVSDFIAQPGHPAPLKSISSSRVTSFALPPFEDMSSSFSAPGAQPEYHLGNYTLPGSSCASSLPPPRSYAADERTFGRRLHRASQEAGFLLASMNSPPPTWYLKVFGFCLHFETREEIRERMGEAVSQARGSTLNNWRYPFTNLGGAGLFYPDVNSSTPDGNQAGGELPIGNRALQHEAYKPSELTGFSMGPFSPAVEEVRDLRLNPLLRILDPGFQGDFFDADEIEICLRGYGVTIPPNKDFVIAQIDMAMLEGWTGSDGSKSAQGSAGMTGTALLAPHSRDHVTTPIVTMASFADPTLPGDNSKTTQVRKTTVTVDVERLITSLVNITVCLGRTPAVRPKDVRRSLKESLILEDQ
ncbi:hypothetical protein B0J13DRAFT_635087, partial [Dactylonectria estremocensis]